MAEAHVDNPGGEIRWFAGYGPAEIVGPCTHPDCPHDIGGTIAYGPSLDRYVLDVCSVRDGCAGSCRAWADGRGRTTTSWLEVRR